ncbi:MAG: elongation factor G, partial [Rhodothermales bacterium]
AFREAYAKAQPTILEPLMKVEIATPNEFQGAVIGNVSQRRGVITGTIEDAQFSTITTDVPLSEMFGYVGDLRSLTQGKAEFTMEFARYAPVPNNVKEELMKKFYDRANARRG